MIPACPSKYQSIRCPDGTILPGTHDTQDIWRRVRLPTDMRWLTFLDIGCAAGAYMLEALRLKASGVTGIDEAPDCCAWAQAALGESNGEVPIHVVCGTYPEVQETLLPHDIVIALSVIHHQEYPLRFLRALRAHTKGTAWVEWELWDEGLQGRKIEDITDGPMPLIPGAPWGRGAYPTVSAAVGALHTAGFTFIENLGRVRNTDCGPRREVFVCR